MTDSTWLKSKLTNARGEKARLAEYVGVTPDVISKMISGGRQIHTQEFLRIQEFFDGARAPESPPAGAMPAESADLVPVYDIQASAGFGALVEYEEQTGSLAFPPDYLRTLTSSSPKNLAVITVKGDSMENTLLDDDVVLIDMSKTHVGYEGMFVLRHNDTLLVKRAGMAGRNGYVTLLSDNPAYPPVEAAIEDIHVVGKVLWYGRKV